MATAARPEPAVPPENGPPPLEAAAPDFELLRSLADVELDDAELPPVMTEEEARNRANSYLAVLARVEHEERLAKGEYKQYQQLLKLRHDRRMARFAASVSWLVARLEALFAYIPIRKKGDKSVALLNGRVGRRKGGDRFDVEPLGDGRTPLVEFIRAADKTLAAACIRTVTYEELDVGALRADLEIRRAAKELHIGEDGEVSLKLADGELVLLPGVTYEPERQTFYASPAPRE